MSVGICRNRFGSLPVVFAVVEEDFFAWLYVAKGLEAGSLPATGDDTDNEPGLRLTSVSIQILISADNEPGIKAKVRFFSCLNFSR